MTDFLNVTQGLAIAEVASDPNVHATQALVLAESASVPNIHATQVLVIAESKLALFRVTQTLVLVEIKPTPPRLPVFITGIRMTDFYQLPEEVTGYALDQGTSFWKVCVPEETINLLDDPSWETETTDLGSLIYMGARSKKTNDTLLTKTFIATVTGAHTFSFYVANQDANFYDDVYVKIEGGVIGEEEQITIEKAFPTKGNHQWVRCEITFPCIAGGQYQVGISSYSPARYISTDCWQVEAKPYATTYVDGDMGMWFPEAASEYYWTGLRHRSTSVRTNRTRTGGKLVSLEDYDFKTTSVIGLGATPIDIPFQQLLSGRIVPGQARYRQREFIIGGAMFGCSLDKLNFNRRALAALFRPKVNNITEPVRLHVRFSEVDDEFQLFAYYLDGLEGNVTNVAQERLAIRLGTGEFPHYMNNFHGQELTATMPSGSKFYDYAYIENDTSGVIASIFHTWLLGVVAPPHHVNGVLRTDDNVFIFGSFTDLVAELGPTETMATGLTDGTVAFGMAYTQDQLYPYVLVGDFKTVVVGDDGFDAFRIAKYNATLEEWVPVGRGVGELTTGGGDSYLYCTLVHNGYIYAGGDFISAINDNGTPVSVKCLARYNISTGTWQDLGDSVYDLYYAIKLGPDGMIYAIGRALSEAKIKVYNPNTGTATAFAPAYTGATSYAVKATDVVFDRKGNPIFLATEIITGVEYGVIAIPRGATWKKHIITLSETSVPPYPNHIPKIYVDRLGRLLISGNITKFNDTDLGVKAPYYIVWDLIAADQISPATIIWQNQTLDHDAAPTVFTTVGSDGYFVLPQRLDGSNNYSNFVEYGAKTTISYAGTAPTRGRIYITGNGTLYGLYNYTNHQQIVFREPLVFASNEDIIIYEKNGALTIRRIGTYESSDITLSVLPSASSWKAFDLYPGDNIITAMFVEDGGEIFFFWQDAFDAL